MFVDRRQQRDLLRAILAEPSSDEPRLVYADWLEEQGDPLSEMIRLQVRLEHERTAIDPKPLEARLRELAGTFGFDRPAQLRLDRYDPRRRIDSDWSYGIERGLVTLYLHQIPRASETVALPPPEWFERFGWFILELKHPIGLATDLRVDAKGLDRILALPILDRCVGVNFDYLGLKPDSARCLAEAPAVANFLSLDLRSNSIGPKGAQSLADSPHLAELVSLNLADIRLGDEGVARLAESRAFPGLQHLRLASVGATGVGITALARSQNLRHLRELDLGSARIDAVAADALAASTAFPALERLGLTYFKGGNDGLRVIAGAVGLSNLREINLADSKVNDKGVVPLIRSASFPRLRKINLDRTHVRADTVEALMQTDRFLRDGKLQLWSCGLPNAALQPLRASPRSVMIESLRVPFSRIDDEGIRTLAQSPCRQSLRVLELFYSRIGTVGAEILTDLAVFPRLERLVLCNNPIADDGALALARWVASRGSSDLDLSKTGLTTLGWRRVLASVDLSRLRRVDLSSNALDEEVWTDLANHPATSGWERLDVRSPPLTQRGAEALIASPFLSPAIVLRVNKEPDLPSDVVQSVMQRFPNASI